MSYFFNCNKIPTFFVHQALLYLMILLQKSESCPPFISPINNVDKCPENKTEWLKATERKQCNRINPKCTEIHYHCLPDRFLGQFIEVCAAPKLIVGK